jgi:hypothetical protein
MTKATKHETLTPEQAEQAIYLDFEGFAEKPPVLAGFLGNGVFEQVVLDPSFESAGRAWRLRCESGATNMAQLVALCRSEDRKLVCYSEHELLVMRSSYDLDAADIYVNARPLLKRWKNRFHRKVPIADWSLRSFCEAFNYPIRENLRDKSITNHLRYVRQMLEQREKFKRLTDAAKVKWRTVLEQNKIDCYAMRRLVQRAAKALAGARAGSRWRTGTRKAEMNN